METEPSHGRLNPDTPDPESLPRPVVDSLEAERQHERLMAKMFGLEPQATQLGHYVLLAELGRGGMGVVYEAYDRKLDRRVALKLLQRREAGRSAPRLGREAQGLAKLSHPNVVQIYETGEHQGREFLVMEFVVGETLREWMARELELADKLELLLQAGRGLAAAHAAGLIHRDFKPDNVMIGEDGRARVLDFGLVRGMPREGAAELSARDRARQPDARWLERSLTAVGAIVGTPAYMAPEQLTGEPCDAAADQFAYCVVAFEVLYGCRPFEGRGYLELLASIGAGLGEVRERTQGQAVPERARAAILRGLEARPEARWPGVQELLDELEAALIELTGGLKRLRRRWAAGAVLLSASTVALTAGLFAETPVPLCSIDSEVLDGAWDGSRRDALRSSFAVSELAAGEQLLGLSEQALDSWAESWVEASRASCEATRVQGLQSERIFELRAACLDRKRRTFATTVDLLVDGEPKLLARVDEILLGLPDLGACADLDNLDQAPSRPQDPANEKRLRELEVDRDRARALMLAGDLPGALALLEQLNEGAQELAYVPLQLEVGGLEGELSLMRGKLDEGAALMADAAREAEALHLDELAATLSVKLAERLAGEWSQPERERWLVEDAEAAVLRVGRDDDPRHVDLMVARADLASAEGQHERALELYQDARERGGYRSELEIANVLADLGRYEQAEAALARILDDLRVRYGERSPARADAEYNAGLLARESGEFELAEARLSLASSIYDEVFGPDSIAAAEARFALASLWSDLGRIEEAHAAFDACLVVFERERGPHDALVGQVLSGLGVVKFYAGEYAASLADYERALAITSEIRGVGHEELAILHSNIGESRLALGEFEGALEDFEQALGPLRGTPQEYRVATAHKGRGQALLELGRAEEALASLERAVELLESGGISPSDVADTHLSLAEALDSLGREPERARALAEGARETLEQALIDDEGVSSSGEGAR